MTQTLNRPFKPELINSSLLKDFDEAQINFIGFNSSHMSSFSWKIKRVFDLFASIIGLVFISPLLITISLLIKLDSNGPVLFKQKRIGLNGRQFEMLKFRSMRVDAENMLDELLRHNESNFGMFKMQNDPRMTKIGRFLRKYSLDELPQLFNVLKGEMSLVGPRPPISRELQSYKPWHYIRFSTLPGLTGLWQVSGRSKIKDFDSVVNLDAKYIRNWNILLDLQILFRTIPVVLLGKNSA